MIDRKKLVNRHDPHYTRIEADAPLSVGNGRFCFTADITGLQSLNELYNICPLCAMAEWGWHSYADAPKDDRALRLEMFNTVGRNVGYATGHTGQEELFYALRQNAHKVSLFRCAFTLDGSALAPDAITGVSQRLDMWRGVLESEFYIEGLPVRVITFVHPQEDTLCVMAESPLLGQSRLKLEIVFPYGSHKISGADFAAEEKHITETTENKALPGEYSVTITRRMDSLRYEAELICEGGSAARTGLHRFEVKAEGEKLKLRLRLTPKGSGIDHADGFEESLAVCECFWRGYWERGGALELSDSKDPRAFELERRVTLSQYLVAIQSRGELPPAETGLTINSWYGKFNVEMHCWHQAHFALWGRHEEMLKSLAWYKRILPRAREIARSQGYAGARWPKLCDATGYNSPSSIAVLLIWQQPHPVMLAELCRRSGHGIEAFLREYRDVIVESAEFMADFARFDGARYVLGSPYIPSQERFDPNTVLNAGFEVEYFRWGLKAAANWQRLLGEQSNPLFEQVAEKLAAPAIHNGVYPAHENCPETYVKPPFNTDHPSMTAMLGLLPGDRIDPDVMAATLNKILTGWDMDSTWGWDFPMLAMTAARLGRPGQAIDLLLMDSPKNRWLKNGHNMQGDKADLPLYLPGNGALLLAVGMMASGWDGSRKTHAPGFPGSFNVNAEGIAPYKLL